MNYIAPIIRHKIAVPVGLIANPEMALLGGLERPLNQTRVMAANIQSSFSRPADLDAFLRGHFKAC